LIDVPADSTDLPIRFRKTSLRNIARNTRPNAIPDIFGLLLVTILLTLGNNVLILAFCETNVECLGTVEMLTVKVLAFLVCEGVGWLIRKALVKVGFYLTVKGIVDNSLVGHAVRLGGKNLGRSATFLFLHDFCLLCIFIFSALADFFMTAVRSFSGLWVSPTSEVN